MHLFMLRRMRLVQCGGKPDNGNPQGGIPLVCEPNSPISCPTSCPLTIASKPDLLNVLRTPDRFVPFPQGVLNPIALYRRRPKGAQAFSVMLLLAQTQAAIPISSPSAASQIVAHPSGVSRAHTPAVGPLRVHSPSAASQTCVQSSMLCFFSFVPMALQCLGLFNRHRQQARRVSDPACYVPSLRPYGCTVLAHVPFDTKAHRRMPHPPTTTRSQQHRHASP